jgi:hypothetical protein
MELRDRLSNLGLEPHFGIHGIYELARGFLSEGAKADAQCNFQILFDLEPVFGPTTKILFRKELDRLRTGALVIPVLDELDHAQAKYQVGRMAEGLLETEGKEFIRRREANIDRDYPLFTAYQLRQSREFRASVARKPKTFDEVLTQFEAQVPGMLRQILGNRATSSEADELDARLNTFLALRSTVRAKLYLWAIPLMHGVGFSRDKNDDYRHVIEASYAEVFVTGDGQLAQTVPRIHPGLQVLTWDELRAG